MHAVSRFPSRTVIFREQYQERIFDASDEELLSSACLLVLRERYTNPAWGYKPKRHLLSEEEQQFILFYEAEGQYLPILLKRYADRVLEQIQSRSADEDDPDWSWYHKVEELLSLPEEKATGYKFSYKGRLIPTSYYLLLQRQSHPNESISVVENSSR